MAYDEHYRGSEESGSVSSLPFVQSGIELGLQYISQERVVAALPFYTRLWRETKTKNGVELSSNAYGMSAAESVLQSNGVSASWDDTTSQYYAEFKMDGGTYKIWLEEETSLDKKLEAVFAQNVAGVAFWKLGFERPATWTTIAKYVQN
jgi:spore germination protein YaaH